VADALDQSEVDALLAAVEGGGADLRFQTPRTRQQRPDAGLEALHEGFGRNFGAALSGYLRTIIEVSRRSYRAAHLQRIHPLPAQSHLL
jgi:flagellar motor switch protein FliM